MKIIYNKNTTLEKPGIYFIKCLTNDKKYIGSSTMKIFKRIQHHYLELKRNNHKNQHLQNAWNKYGEDAFQFIIFENLEKTNCLSREQELLNSENFEDLYNINSLASGTPNLSRETIEKRTKTFKETTKKASEYYFLVKKGNITIEDVPEKYRKIVKFRLSHIPWNKGKTKEDTDFSHLRGIKKTRTAKLVEAKKQIHEKVLNNLPPVYVYDSNKNFIKKYKNSIELESLTTVDNHELSKYMVLKNKVGRNGYNKDILKKFNINKSCNYNNPYKGLYFSRKPLHQEIGE
jgi:group I intron endonuclease